METIVSTCSSPGRCSILPRNRAESRNEPPTLTEPSTAATSVDEGGRLSVHAVICLVNSEAESFAFLFGWFPLEVTKKVQVTTNEKSFGSPYISEVLPTRTFVVFFGGVTAMFMLPCHRKQLIFCTSSYSTLRNTDP